MISYITIVTNNLERAAQFYDKLLSELGVSRFMAFDEFIAWGFGTDKPGIAVTNPFDGNPATMAMAL